MAETKDNDSNIFKDSLNQKLCSSTTDLRSKSMVPTAQQQQQHSGAVKNSRAYSRKQDSVEDSDETAIMSKPMEKENKKPAPAGNLNYLKSLPDDVNRTVWFSNLLLWWKGNF